MAISGKQAGIAAAWHSPFLLASFLFLSLPPSILFQVFLLIVFSSKRSLSHAVPFYVVHIFVRVIFIKQKKKKTVLEDCLEMVSFIDQNVVSELPYLSFHRYTVVKMKYFLTLDCGLVMKITASASLASAL